MSQPTPADAANAARLRELFELIRLRVARGLPPGGGELVLKVRVERGGRIGRANLGIEELLQSEGE